MVGGSEVVQLLDVQMVGCAQSPSRNNGVAKAELVLQAHNKTRHRVMVQPEEGVGPLLAALYGAKRRIYLKIFSLEDTSLIQAIIDAHRRGVDCRVQLNHVRADGSMMNEDTFETLNSAGVPTVWTNPKFDVTHEKSLVVDEQAWICTFNFARKFFEKVRGYAIITDNASEVEEIVACFKADWERRPFVSQSDLLFGGPGSRERILELIDSAQHSLDIQHKKLADTAVLAHLLNALARGVKVRFLGSGQKGVHGADLFENAASLGILKDAGGLVHKIKRPKIHAKLIIVDGRVAQVGSMNLTRHCFEHRREVGIMVRTRAEVEELQTVFERDWSDSRSWTPPDPATIEV